MFTHHRRREMKSKLIINPHIYFSNSHHPLGLVVQCQGGRRRGAPKVNANEQYILACIVHTDVEPRYYTHHQPHANRSRHTWGDAKLCDAIYALENLTVVTYTAGWHRVFSARPPSYVTSRIPLTVSIVSALEQTMFNKTDTCHTRHTPSSLTSPKDTVSNRGGPHFGAPYIPR